MFRRNKYLNRFRDYVEKEVSVIEYQKLLFALMWILFITFFHDVYVSVVFVIEFISYVVRLETYTEELKHYDFRCVMQLKATAGKRRRGPRLSSGVNNT